MQIACPVCGRWLPSESAAKAHLVVNHEWDGEEACDAVELLIEADMGMSDDDESLEGATDGEPDEG